MPNAVIVDVVRSPMGKGKSWARSPTSTRSNC